MAGALFAALAAADASGPDVFAFLAPDVTLDAEDRARLDAHDPIVQVRAGKDGMIAMSALVRVDAPVETFVAWAQDLASQQGRYVPEIGRFSVPPRLEDLQALTLEPDDLAALSRCRPGACAVKLSDDEMTHLAAIDERAALERGFREMLVARAAEYLTRGDAAMPPYHDHATPLRPAEAFAEVADRLTFFPKNLPCHANYLRGAPAAHDARIGASFLYWSKETLGMRPIISITHLSVSRVTEPGLPAAVAAARQVYATHYKNAALTVTALLVRGDSRYVAYVNRTSVDAFQGLFGGMVRGVVERRVKAEAPGVLRALQRRLQSGGAGQ